MREQRGESTRSTRFREGIENRTKEKDSEEQAYRSISLPGANTRYRSSDREAAGWWAHGDRTALPEMDQIPKRRIPRPVVVIASLGIVLLATVFVAARIVEAGRRHAQMQTDPNVATAWVIGVTRGPNHALTQGSPFQKWLNEAGI